MSENTDLPSASTAIKSRSPWRDWLTNPWLLVAFLIVFFAVVSQFKSSGVISDAETDAVEFPQIYMTNVNIREYAENGDLTHQISTEKIVQYQIEADAPSARDYYLLHKPVFTFYDKNPTPWQASADIGQGLTDGKIIELKENVVIKQHTNDYGLLTLETQALQIETRSQFAHTDKAVTMRGPKAQVDAIGMQARLSENKVNMLSNVRVTYEQQ